MFSTEFPNSLKFFLPSDRKYQIILAGCGGTGSWLAPAIARTARWLSDRGKEVMVTFVDPDQVEEKNVYRQNFCSAEIGRNKAETLACRYGTAWGIEIGAIPYTLSDHCIAHDNGLTLICGCLDRESARKDIKRIIRLRSRFYWLDSGNSQSSGQVLFGGPDIKEPDPFVIKGMCTWLPLPAKQHPELVMVVSTPADPSTPSTSSGIGNSPSAGSLTTGPEMSCAEMVLRDAQGMAINQRMAAEMADYLVRLLVTKDLRKYATYIDLESGTCQSKYITKEGVEIWMK